MITMVVYFLILSMSSYNIVRSIELESNTTFVTINAVVCIIGTICFAIITQMLGITFLASLANELGLILFLCISIGTGFLIAILRNKSKNSK